MSRWSTRHTRGNLDVPSALYSSSTVRLQQQTPQQWTREVPETIQKRVQEAHRKLFGELQSTPGQNPGERSPRTGRKLLKKQLKGHAYADYVAPGVDDMKFRDYVDPEVDWNWEYKKYLEKMGDLKSKDKERDGFKPKWHVHQDVQEFNQSLTNYNTDDEYPTESEDEELLDNREESDIRFKIHNLLERLEEKQQQVQERQSEESPELTSEQNEHLQHIKEQLDAYENQISRFSQKLEGGSGNEEADVAVPSPEMQTALEEADQDGELQKAADEIREYMKQITLENFDVGWQNETNEAEEQQSLNIDIDAIEKEIEPEVLKVLESQDENGGNEESDMYKDSPNYDDPVYNSRPYASFEVFRSGLLAKGNDATQLLPELKELLAMSTYESQNYSLLESEIESDESDIERDLQGLPKSQVYRQRLVVANWLKQGIEWIEQESEHSDDGKHRLQLFSNFVTSDKANECWKKEKNILDSYANLIASKFSSNVSQ